MNLILSYPQIASSLDINVIIQYDLWIRYGVEHKHSIS